ncbi:MAG: DUF4159 domain-containing protein [Verrucomicrobiales bacterium]|nr:DUF4159 domain-containing protein [Verrucomicrobiales bacterium]
MRSLLSPLLILSVLAFPLFSPRSTQAEESIVQCANLIYAGTKTSRCFSDQFLTNMQQKTAIPVERRFRSVKLASDELFDYPFVMMTGESSFFLTTKERENLKRYLANGGFLLASAGCSNKDWGRSFRSEMKKIFEDDLLKEMKFDHPLFRTVYNIDQLELSKSSGEGSLEGIEVNGKIVVVFSEEGLNDSSNRAGCCCCGGNEIQNAMEVNVNILAYALLY